MKEEFKYAKTKLNTIIGMIWLTSALLNIVIFLFTLIKLPNAFMMVYFIFGILQFVYGVYTLNLHKRNYVAVNSWALSYHRGIVIPVKDIPLSDVEIIKIIGSDIRIGMKSGKEHRIRLKALTVKSIDRLYEILNMYEETHGYDIGV